MKKRSLCLVLAVVMLLCLCSCGGGTGRYKIIRTLDSREYSIAFRSGDSTYHYVDKALRQLNYDGEIDALAQKWLGDDGAVSFAKQKNAMAQLGYVEPRDFIIGVDLDSYPMCFESGDGYDGFDVELARLVCQKLGWTLKVQPIRSEDTYAQLNSGNIDCAWGGVACDTDTDKYTVLRTYAAADLVIAAKNGNSVGGRTLYMGTSQYYLDVLAENKNISDRLGQISRLNGTMTELFAALDRDECELILTTDLGVYYANR